MGNKKPTPRMITSQAAADRLDVSLRTIRRMTKSGAIRSVKLGRLVRIPETEIQKIETARRTRVIY